MLSSYCLRSRFGAFRRPMSRVPSPRRVGDGERSSAFRPIVISLGSSSGRISISQDNRIEKNCSWFFKRNTAGVDWPFIDHCSTAPQPAPKIPITSSERISVLRTSCEGLSSRHIKEANAIQSQSCCSGARTRRRQEALSSPETIRAYETIYFPAQKIHFACDNRAKGRLDRRR
jgi:hypothetical protein